MVDRHAGYVVTLDESVREDDAEMLMYLLRNIKGVRDVRPVLDDPMLTVAKANARRELQDKFYAFYRSTFDWEVSKAGSAS